MGGPGENVYSLVVDVTSRPPSPIAEFKNQHTYSTLNLEDRMNLRFWVFGGASWSNGNGPLRTIPPRGSSPERAADLPADTDSKPSIWSGAHSNCRQARTGLRFVHDRDDGTPWYDFELSVFYENWSAIDAFDVALSGTINGETPEDIILPRKWMDTVSVRFGGDYHLGKETGLNDSPGLTLRAGGYWESAATPPNYEHLDFPSFEEE